MKFNHSVALVAAIAVVALTFAAFTGEAHAASALTQHFNAHAGDLLGGGSGAALVGLGLKELKALREKRRGHLDTARALIETAEREGRDLTAEERASYEAECRSAEETSDKIETEVETIERSAGGNPAPQPGLGQPGNQPQDPAAIARQAVAEERTRVTTIRQRVAASGLPSDFADGLVERGVAVDRVSDLIIDELAQRGQQGGPPHGSGIVIGHSSEDPAVIRAAMSDAIVLRRLNELPQLDDTETDAQRQQRTDQARAWMRHGLLDLCADLARAHGERVPDRLPRAALYDHLVQLRVLSTSDFPILLADAANKILVRTYRQANVTYRMIAARKTFTDFKAHKFIRSGDFPALLEVGESGEFKQGSMGEAKQELTLATWGRILNLSRRVLINDDLGAFANLPVMAGRRVADFENATFYAQLALNSNDGPTITETSRPLANTTDNTKASSNAAISVTSVGIGREKMMGQTSIDGLKLNIVPRFLLTGPAKFTVAEQFCSVNIVPTQDGNANPFKGKLEPIGDANLSGNGWWLFADPADIETMVYGHLEGAEGPRFQTREGFTTDGVEFKVADDFVAGAIDYRGAFRNAGA